VRTKVKTLRALIVDDNRDGADALGLLVEALGHQVHVTYGGTQALDVATAFRPDVILVDLLMPDMNGNDLVMRLRQISTFAHTKIVAITGLKDEEHRTSALKSGFDAYLVKPAKLAEIKTVLATVVPAIAPTTNQSSNRDKKSVSLGTERRLPIDEARRIRNERPSKTLTQSESEAAICDGIIRFQDEYMGRRSDHFHSWFIKDLLIVRIEGALTQAERQLGKSSSPEKGRDLIKEVRKQLLETARPMLESLVHEVTGVKVLSLHHDISTVTGEEVVLFSLVNESRFG
jgi:CheY-like chemotaxis protein